MDLARYITEEAKIEAIKNEYLDSGLSMKDMLNGKYSELPIEDKANLIYWSCDYERFKVLKSGKVVNKYTVNKLSKIVEKYAKEDGCVHYILKEADGAITQTCDVWVNFNIDNYVRVIHAKVMKVIYP